MNPLSTAYNKTVATGLAMAAITLVAAILKRFGVELAAEEVGALNTIAGILIPLLIPNKDA